jgi:hypothetical protein
VVVTGGIAYAATSKPSGLPTGVYFQNEGTLQGWDNPNPHPQWKGVITNASNPSYKGGTAIVAQQTYVTSNGTRYHAEVVHQHVQSMGQDRYYGEALYLPANWVFHNQPVAFEQWAGENPGGPWLLMEVNGNKLRYLDDGGTGYNNVASLDNLRGTWIRIVTHIHMAKNGGQLDIWVNGNRVVSRTGKYAPGKATTLRWSTGLYETYWFRERPKGPHTLTLYLDHFRVASSYALAEPANW